MRWVLKKINLECNDFKKLVENYYYVDKTNQIERFINDKKYVTCITRPSKFGKSVFMSMLDNFYNIEYANTNKKLFKGLKIENSECYKYL